MLELFVLDRMLIRIIVSSAHHFIQDVVAGVHYSFLKPAWCGHGANLSHAEDHSAQPGESMKSCHGSGSVENDQLRRTEQSKK